MSRSGIDKLLLSVLIFSHFLAVGSIRDFTKKVFDENRDFNGIFVYTIVQDNDGFLWIGSDDGLYRFDGKTMLNFNERDSTIGDLVTASAVSNDGHLMLGYYHGGISTVEHGIYRKIVSETDLPEKVVSLKKIPGDDKLLSITSKGTFIFADSKSYTLQKSNYFDGLIINDLAIFEDKVLVATNEGLFESTLFQDSISRPKVWEQTEYIPVSSIFLSYKNNRAWIGTEEGLAYISLPDWSYGTFDGIDFSNINCLTQDLRGNLWVGTQTAGLYEIKYYSDSDFKWTHFSKANGFESNEINYLFTDEEDEVWVGTFGKGLVQLNRSDFHHYNLTEELAYGTMHSTAYLDEQLFIGTDNGLLIAFYENDLDSLTFSWDSRFIGSAISRLKSIDDYLLIAVDDQGLFRLERNGSLEKMPLLDEEGAELTGRIRAIEMDIMGNLLVSYEGLGVIKYDPDFNLLKHWNTNNQFYHNEIFALATEADGTIWYGARGSGLARLDGTSQQMEYLTRDGNFPSFDINSIILDNSNKLWIATDGQGVYSFDGVEFVRYSKSNGLQSDFANGLIVDHANQIWVTHRKGLSLIQQEVNIVRVFTHPEEMGETEAVLNSLTIDQEGNIWVGNPHGVAIFYQYKLDGYDQEWSPIVKNNFATYTNLSPGEYKFLVKESDHKGLWRENYASIGFEIDYPYWEKWWFYLSELGFIALVTFVSFKFLSRIENKYIARLIIYVSVFLIFEFVHTRFEPYLDEISGEVPIFQVGINLILALVLFPVEGLITVLFKKKAMSAKAYHSNKSRFEFTNKVYSADRSMMFFNLTDKQDPENSGYIFYAKLDPATGKITKTKKYPYCNEQPGNKVLRFRAGKYRGWIDVQVQDEVKTFPIALNEVDVPASQ